MTRRDLAPELTHAGCGGALYEDDTRKTYAYTLDDGRVITVPATYCAKCGKEILGDIEIDIEGLDT